MRPIQCAFLVFIAVCSCAQVRTSISTDGGPTPDAAFPDAGQGAGRDGGADAGTDVGSDAGIHGGLDAGADAVLLCGVFQEDCIDTYLCIDPCTSGGLLSLTPAEGNGTCSCGSTGSDECTNGAHCLCQICAPGPGICVTPGQQACLCATEYNQTFQCEAPELDAGHGTPDAGCSLAADCSSRGQSVSSCSEPDAGDEPSGESCIAGECVLECGGGGRTCTVTSDGGCLSCGTSQDCPAASCGQVATWGAATVEESSCSSLVTANAVLSLAPGAGCTLNVGLSRTELSLGTWTQLADGALLADMPDLGGVCTGITLPTNAVRVAWSCPACQFVVMP